MKKFILFFSLLPLISIGQNCGPNVQLGIDAGNTQGFCAPIEIDFPVTFPSEINRSAALLEQYPASERYLFILFTCITNNLV